MAKSRRIIKTVDDARQALVDLTPNGFCVTLYYHYSHSIDGGHTFINVDLHAVVYRAGCSHERFPRIEANTPFDLVRKFVAEIVPLLRPPGPPPRPPRQIKGKVVPRLTYEPLKKDLFS